jgi:hypothetical protein
VPSNDLALDLLCHVDLAMPAVDRAVATTGVP